jgi:hypothetical protein
LNILSKTYIYNQTNISVDFLLDETIYINATKVAKQFNKLPADWLRTKETKEYIKAIAHYGNLHNGDLVVVRKGGNDLSLTGTWIHRKLIIAFARWLSPDFAVWCDMTIEDILKSKQQTPEKPHQIQNETFDLSFYTQQSREMIELTQLINSQNSKTLYYLDNLSKSLNIKSPLELLKIDLSSYYFIPTELGNFINRTAVETNKILESKGFQIRENGVWHLTEKGRSFGIEVQNGSYFQLKWKIKSII